MSFDGNCNHEHHAIFHLTTYSEGRVIKFVYVWRVALVKRVKSMTTKRMKNSLLRKKSSLCTQWLFLSWFSHCICLPLRESGNEWFSKSHKKKVKKKKNFSVRRLFNVNFILAFCRQCGKNMLKNSFASKSTIPSTIHALGPFLRSSTFFVYFLLLL